VKGGGEGNEGSGGDAKEGSGACEPPGGPLVAGAEPSGEGLEEPPGACPLAGLGGALGRGRASASVGATLVFGLGLPLSFIVRFGLPAHFLGSLIQAAEAGHRSKNKADDGQPAVCAKLAIQPSAAQKTDEDREDDVQADSPIIGQSLPFALHAR
jgi:hypothetical protein